MKKLLITFLFISTMAHAAQHLYTEKQYQAHWCKAHKGKLEARLDDGTRVDCLTPTLAVEFDFAPKWHECIG